MTDAHNLLDKAQAAFNRDDAAQAWQFACQAVKLLPKSFDAQSFAATAALSAGELSIAVQHFSLALKLAPSIAAQATCWLGSGRAWLQLGDPERAHKAFRRGISLIPEWPPLLTGLATALLDLGRTKEAEETARKALSGNPQDKRAQVILGATLIKQDRFSESNKLLGPLREDSQVGVEARHYFAMSRMISGDIEAALSEIRRLIDDNRCYADYSHLAQIVSFTSKEDPDFLRLSAREAELADIQGPQRLDLLFALAKAYDDIDETDKACRYLREANALEAIRKPYDPAGDEKLMAQITRLFTSDFVRKYSQFGITGLQPIFVISLPRSGSTLLEQMLAAHSAVNSGGEMEYLSRIANGLSLKWGARDDFPDIAPEDAAIDLRQAAALYKNRTTRLTLFHSKFTDKSTQNFLYVGLIRMLLPGAHIIHIRRHPLATALGLYRQWFAQGVRYSYDLNSIARYMKAYSELMEHWRESLPGEFIEVRYENLVTDPKQQLQRIFEYLDLEFEPGCLEFHRVKLPVHTASQVQVRKELDASRLERHKRYSKLLAPVEHYLKKEIADYEDKPC